MVSIFLITVCDTPSITRYPFFTTPKLQATNDVYYASGFNKIVKAIFLLLETKCLI